MFKWGCLSVFVVEGLGFRVSGLGSKVYGFGMFGALGLRLLRVLRFGSEGVGFWGMQNLIILDREYAFVLRSRRVCSGMVVSESAAYPRGRRNVLVFRFSFQ